MTAQGGFLTKNEYAYGEVRARIMTGALPQGSPILQGQLAVELGVSTTPLREALRRLSAEGLVTLESHRDARVTALTVTEARSLVEVRQRMDPLAAGLAAERRTDAQLARIEVALARLTPLHAGSDLAEMEVHREFHRAVYTASANDLLIDLLEGLWDKADRYRRLGLTQPRAEPDAERVRDQHAAIARAIAEGDADAAEQMMWAHVSRSHVHRALSHLESEQD
jgi:DNA-binding GntR family transcriptional regulator